MAKKHGKAKRKFVSTGTGLEGINDVMKNINFHYDKMKGEKTAAGLARVAILIRQSGENDSPTTPMDTGNLRASFFAAIKDAKGPLFGGSGVGKKSEQRGEVNTTFQQMVVSTARQEAAASPYPIMYFGYSAIYAAAVHEMVGENIKWKKKGSGAKYFEHSLRSKKGEILQTLAESMKL